MTYEASSIPDFCDALQAQLRAALDAGEGQGKVPVAVGPPDATTFDRPEWVMVGDVRGDGHIQVYAATTQPRDEDYTVAVLISVALQTSKDQATVDARAWTIYDYLQQLIRGGGGRLGLSKVKWSVVWVDSVSRRADDRVRECVIEAGVQVRARIR
jgi:hypothetical protein